MGWRGDCVIFSEDFGVGREDDELQRDKGEREKWEICVLIGGMWGQLSIIVEQISFQMLSKLLRYLLCRVN